MTYRILTINPGSTSTKIGLFDDDQEVFVAKVEHSSEKMASFETLFSQMPYRRNCILSALHEAGYHLHDIDAFVGRGGGLLPMEGGTYEIDGIMLDHALNSANGVVHPANLGSLLANEFASFAKPGGAPSFVVNPPDVDELCDEARMTGAKGVYRHVHLHALNLKETAIRHAATLGKAYEECNFVVCHIGGGISVSAHRHGAMIDGNDIVGGEGPMTPTRCGSIPVVEVLNYLEAGHTTAEARKLCMKTGGFVDLIGTNNAQECEQRSATSPEAARAWATIKYQICHWIGAMACALDGQVDGILLGGAMVHSDDLVQTITTKCGWIAPVTAYPGEFELEAMAAGALRVLTGKEEAKTYTGVPSWNGFDD